MGTSVNRSSAEDQLYRRGESFRIPGMQVDGMDVLAVRGSAEVALEWVRAGKGPILLELKTYRYRGHSMRSEEHTSELQSLMRISYAVFCLKQNTKPLRTPPNRAPVTPTLMKISYNRA